MNLLRPGCCSEYNIMPKRHYCVVCKLKIVCLEYTLYDADSCEVKFEKRWSWEKTMELKKVYFLSVFGRGGGSGQGAHCEAKST